MTMSIRADKLESDNGTKPICVLNGEYGKATVMIKPKTLKPKRYLPGVLLKKFFCVRTIKIINNSVRIDSTNQPV